MSVVAVLPHFLASASKLEELVLTVLNQQSVGPCQIVIVANNPQNRAFEAVVHLPDVEVLEPGLNMGYVGALEFVRRRYPAEFLWILQEDLQPLPDCLVSLHAAFGQAHHLHRLAVASPIEVDSNGLPSAASRIGKIDLGTALGLRATREDRERAMLPWSQEDVQIVMFTYLSGALVNSNALEEIGGFDVELWPLMAVDVDTCAALQLSGYSITLVADARIRHERDAPRSYPRFHHWKEIAAARNHRRLQAKYSHVTHKDSAEESEIPQDILYSLAKSMSEFLSEYSDWVYRTSWRRVAWQAKRTLRRCSLCFKPEYRLKVGSGRR